MPSNRQSRRFRQIQKWKRVIPELATYEDEAACIEDWKRATRAVLGGRRAIALLLLVLAMTVGLVLLFEFIIRPLVPWPRHFFSGFVGGLVGSLAPVTSIWLFRRHVRKGLHDRLLERGIRTCEKCGYNLRGQVEPRCPECGRPFDPTTGPPPPT